MARNSGEQHRNLGAVVATEQDSKQITDLIAQLERDLAETQETATEQG